MQKKLKQESILKKQEPEYSFATKKELARLKTAYKKGRLKFDSKETAKSILNNFKRGLLSK